MYPMPSRHPVFILIRVFQKWRGKQAVYCYSDVEASWVSHFKELEGLWLMRFDCPVLILCVMVWQTNGDERGREGKEREREREVGREEEGRKRRIRRNESKKEEGGGGGWRGGGGEKGVSIGWKDDCYYQSNQLSITKYMCSWTLSSSTITSLVEPRGYIMWATVHLGYFRNPIILRLLFVRYWVEILLLIAEGKCCYWRHQIC